MYIPHFLNVSICCEYLGCFRILAVMHNAVRKGGMYISLQYPVLCSLDIYPKVGLLDHRVILFLIF